jgi:DNA-binding CsgD family transcriptional regulator
MEQSVGDRNTTPAITRSQPDSGITLADKRWAVFSRIPDTTIPASTPPSQLAWRGTDSTWKAADRALAEIAAATRGDHMATGNDRDRLERAVATARDALNEAALAASEAARRALALAEALDATLADLNQNQAQRTTLPRARPSQRVTGNLSQREQEVLQQVAQGRSNKAIADALYVSPNTVKTHVTSLLRKLDVHSRAQLAAIAVQQGL